MASAYDAVSDGSDIDVELDDSGEFLDQNQTVADPIDRQQLAPDIPPDGEDWMNRMLDSDSDDDEFLGFQNSWKFDNFHPRRAAMRFNGASWPSVLHPPEASPLLYTEEMWKHIVDLQAFSRWSWYRSGSIRNSKILLIGLTFRLVTSDILQQPPSSGTTYSFSDTTDWKRLNCS